MKALWIARTLPFPLDAGDRIYSARLMRAFAEAGADLTVTGFAATPAEATPLDWPVRWCTVPGAPHGTLRSLASTQPLVGAAHATPAYRRLMDELAAEAWDVVVIDQYGMGWAMAPFLRRSRGREPPLLVHLAHDHEASLTAALVRGFKGSAVRRLGLWQNSVKTGWQERRIVRRADLVSAITDEDAERFRLDAPATPSVVLTPGYGGAVALSRQIDASVPRNVVMVGSYQWVAKSENLRQFVAAADAAFHAHGITLHVVGSMSEALAQELRASTRATVLHGFKADIAPHFAAARIAVVPEVIGGGFKLKFLDYFFGRVAVATLGQAAAGLPDEIRRAMIVRDDLPALVRSIVDAIDDTPRLSALQQAAFAAAEARYHWADRGRSLREAIKQVAAARRRSAAGQEGALRDPPGKPGTQGTHG